MALGEGCFCRATFTKGHHNGQSQYGTRGTRGKGAKDDVVFELLGHVVQRLMDFEIEQRCGAESGERSEDRSNSRNSYRERLRAKRGRARSMCAYRSCVAAVSFRDFSSPGAPPKKRSSPSSKKRISKASPRDRSTSSSRRWA